MGRKRKIGLIFSYNENWIAGSYYIMNLLEAINLLPAKNDYIIEIISDSDSFVKLKKFDFLSSKYLNLQDSTKLSFFERVFNFFSKKIIGKYIFDPQKSKKSIFGQKYDFIFPVVVRNYYLEFQKNAVFWIPDFQQHFLTTFFTEDEINDRNLNESNITENENFLVVSSQNAMNHMKQFYPFYKTKPFVLNFAVFHPEFQHIDSSLLKQKFNIDRPFYFSPNQFWAHKNHITVLRALKLAVIKEKNILVVFSGKEKDYRNPDYFDKILEYVKQENLESHVRFLGFIDRAEQLKLMDICKAVIQPSLFEGWSTVVEDVKAINQFILLSDLEVHREQCTHNCEFFAPENHEQLSELMVKYFALDITREIKDYSKNLYKFADDFFKIADTIIKNH